MNFRERYGILDRLLHDIAFRGSQAQRALADVEEIVFRERLDGIELANPVFISGLPRSGTTIILRLLAGTGHFASHTYRDMPFVLCPMLWHHFSRRFAVEDQPKERTHGDGLQVSADSPEAFEEVIWKEFWPDHYRSDHILPWTAGDECAEFDQFLETHMRKVVALRRTGPSDRRRYISKNNLNVARIAAPPGPLRCGLFLVPYRDPVQQAASMLTQHLRFTDLHERDDFVRRYMQAIGHHEFGKGLKPVAFGAWLDAAPEPWTLEFWVQYWMATYRHILKHGGSRVAFVSYARLTEEPKQTLGRLAALLEIPTSDLTVMAGRLRPPRTYEIYPSAVADTTRRKAEEVYRELERATTM